MALKDDLIKIKPRETSGSKTSSRFNFQKDWAILLLLESHKKSQDYAILLDYHDDIVLLDSETSPKEIHFYQVKTKKDGKWTLPSLIKRIGDFSILGKLYLNRINFKEMTKSLNLVSNAFFNVKLDNSSEKSGEKRSICLSSLSSEEREKIKKALTEEHSLKVDPDFKNITYLLVTDLSVDDHSGHIKGKLVDFFEGNKTDVSDIYRVLFDEITRKTDYSEDFDSFNKIIEKKAISRSYFQEIINEIQNQSNIEKIWTRIENKLNSDGENVILIRSLRNEWRGVETYFYNPSDEFFGCICEEIRVVVAGCSDKDSQKALCEIVEDILKRFKTQTKIDLTIYNDDVLKVVIMGILYE